MSTITQRRPRRFASALAASGLLAAILATATPAVAAGLLGPQANDDVASVQGRGSHTVDVLENDAWDPSLTAEVTKASLRSFWWDNSSNGVACTIPDPTVSFSAAAVTVDFAAFDCPAKPSDRRMATVTYDLTDSAGQVASATLTISEDRASTPIVAAADTYGDTPGVNDFMALDAPFDTTTPSPWTPTLSPFQNDYFGPTWDDVRVEVVTPPRLGHVDPTDGTYTPDSLDWSKTPAGGGRILATSEPIFDEWTYRLCVVGGSECSAPATVTIDGKRLRALTIPPRTPTSVRIWSFYGGSPERVTFDLRAEAVGGSVGGSVTSAVLEGATPTNVQRASVTGDGSLTPNGDGTWTYQPGPSSADYERFDLDWVRSGGTVATTSLVFRVAPRPVVTLRDDEMWVGLGQTVSLAMLLNDQFANFDALPGALMNGLKIVRQGGLGTASIGSDLAGPRLVYSAGSTRGSDLVSYRLCATWEGPEPVCDSAQVTVHVSPTVAADDDAASVDPGNPVAVDLLANDTFNDITSDSPYRPALTRAKVALTDVPEGITATLQPDRSVVVSAPESMAGQTVTLGYRLTDFTGSSTARVRVKIADVPVTALTPPTAHDDFVTIHEGHGATATVAVLANDDTAYDRAVFRAELGSLSLPRGVTATLVGNEIRVSASRGTTATSAEIAYAAVDEGGRAPAVLHVVIEHNPPRTHTGGAFPPESFGIPLATVAVKTTPGVTAHVAPATGGVSKTSAQAPIAMHHAAVRAGADHRHDGLEGSIWLAALIGLAAVLAVALRRQAGAR